MGKDKIFAIVVEVIEELNEQLNEGKKIKTEPETVLLGKLGVLDSLGIVNFIVMLEQKIEDVLNVQLHLPYEFAIGKGIPLHTIQSSVE
jgi:acyl carrier protein